MHQLAHWSSRKKKSVTKNNKCSNIRRVALINNEHDRKENPSPLKLVSGARNIPINFSQEELLFVDDHVTLVTPPEEFPLLISLKRRKPTLCVAVDLSFIHVIGTALLKSLSSKGKTITVLLSYSDLLHIREIALSQRTYGNSNVGISLKQKIYEGLLTNKFQEEFLSSLLEGIDLDLGVDPNISS